MPELAEDMYCSQQICIPPSFPYLLRQYAKAAIRTQPGDLLRWSTAYFRCLALNLPPPVKPRLEYPIPKSHFGLTPGWLKALMHQLQNNLTIPFKVLWDRWIGACLEHKNLIEVLCLGRFTDAQAIPWFRFVGLCAGHLTESLTQTMILVCEILTEEPEGGSAMIPLEVFTDVYQFLAAIDASEPQNLRNLYFTDSLLSLYREPIEEKKEEIVVEEEEEEEEEIIVAEEVKEVELEKGPVDTQIGVVISCPDIAANDYKREEDFVLQEEGATLSAVDQYMKSTMEKEISSSKSKAKSPVTETGKTPLAETPPVKAGPIKPGKQEVHSSDEDESPKNNESVDTIADYFPPRQRDLELLEDLQKVKEAQAAQEPYEEILGEEEEEIDYDIQRLKLALDGPAGSGIIETDVTLSEDEERREEVEREGEEEEEQTEPEGELIYIDAIPGIGGIVPQHLVEAVLKYMKECATIQHGTVMPRNIRHYNCPPLEILNK